MKTRLSLSILLTIGSLSAQLKPSLANQIAQKPQVRFYCGQSFDISTNKILPTTFAATSVRQDPVAIIRWKSALGYSPQNRCTIVSSNFQKAWNIGRLRFLRAGTSQKTGQGIICGTATKVKKCDESQMLFTLRNANDANDVIGNIREIQRGTNRDPISQSSGDEVVDLEEVLK